MKEATRGGHGSWLPFALYATAITAALTLCDFACHVRFGVLVYARPDRMSLFAGHPTLDVSLGFAGIAASVTFCGWLLFRRMPTPSAARTLTSVAAFFAAYYCSGVFGNEHALVFFLGCLLTWVAHIWLVVGSDDIAGQHTLHIVAFSVLLAIAGPIAEGVYSATGFFHYTQPHAPPPLAVPFWLAGLYLHGGPAVAITIAKLRESVSAPRSVARRE